jgi:hypothetical protein
MIPNFQQVQYKWMKSEKKNQFRKITQKKKHQQSWVSSPNPRLCERNNLIEGKTWKIMKPSSRPNPILNDKIRKMFNLKKPKSHKSILVNPPHLRPGSWKWDNFEEIKMKKIMKLNFLQIHH